jgi:RNAse (barnase) inhibitor barstar
MDEQAPFDPDGPALSALAATPATVADLMLQWSPAHPDWDILRVRGEKAVTSAGFFDELGAALQFPYYFGENWDAVWDCINDVSWLRGPNLLVVFDSAHLLLRDSEDDFQQLMRLLPQVRDRWHEVSVADAAGGRRPLAFHALFSCDSQALPMLTDRLRTYGAPFVRL